MTINGSGGGNGWCKRLNYTQNPDRECNGDFSPIGHRRFFYSALVPRGSSPCALRTILSTKAVGKIDATSEGDVDICSRDKKFVMSKFFCSTAATRTAPSAVIVFPLKHLAQR